MKRILFTLALLTAIFSQAQFSIGNWYQNKECTIIFTFDDWSPGQMYIAVPMMVEKDIDATFFASKTNMWRGQEDFDMMIYGVDNGCEIGNHTDNHWNLPDLDQWQLDGEIDDVKTYYDQNVTNQEVQTFCYPRGKWDPNVRSMVMENHIGARGIQYPVSGSWDYDFAQTEEDYYATPTVTVKGSFSADSMGIAIRKGLEDGGMLTFMFHSIYSNTVNDYWWDEISEYHLEELSDTALAYGDRAWITTYRDAIKYHKEANYSTITVQSNTMHEIVLDIEDGLNSGLYNHDLTVNYQVPHGEAYTSVAQDGNTIAYSVENGVLTFDAQPDGTEIVITKEVSIGFDELSMGFDNINTYPTPSEDIVNVSMELSRGVEASVYVSDLSGQRLLDVSSELSLSAGNNHIDFSVHSLREGMYLLNIKTAEGVVTRKIIKH